MQNETVYLSTRLSENTVDIDGRETHAFVDSGASVSLITKENANDLKTYMGKRINTLSSNDKKSLYDRWTTVTSSFDAWIWKLWLSLWMRWTLLEFLMSRPGMERLNMNVDRDD